MTGKLGTLRAAALALFWVSMLSWVLGCSNSKSSGEHEQAVIGPFTVTLNAPSPMSPIDPVLLADNEVVMGSAANVVTGVTVGMGSGGVESLNAGSSSLLNETWSRAFALVGSSVTIRGILHAATKSLGPEATATGFDTTPPFDPISQLSWTVNWPSGTATDVTLSAGTARTLSPGLYGTVTVNGAANLTLTSGTYFLTGLKLLTANAKVTLDETTAPSSLLLLSSPSRP